jgi:phenylalanyl-tRNA synthetase beta chain
MKVPISWLREFVPIELDLPTLCETLSVGGLAVDDVIELGAEIRGVVIGEIISTAPHPRAERLTLCNVRSGPGPIVTVVCGAKNMKAGDRVAWAPPGTTLPGGGRIEQEVIRGEPSAGMLCSEAELGLSAAADGILIVASDAPLGARIGAYLGIEDTVLDVTVTPNRGDCLSVIGVAREIAALTGARMLRTRNPLRERGAPTGEAIAVRIADPEGCARYAARVVRGVRVGASPAWVVRRLEAVGLRPINNLVDVTNLVMIERGQPLHAFDLERLPRAEIVVRRAGQTTQLRTLDGVDRRLAPDDLLITTGDEAVAIAGVMGGANSEVSDTTSAVLLESAYFDPTSVRRTARRLDLRSEASYRFERGVDIEGVVVAIDRAAVLIKQLAGGEIASGVVDAYPTVYSPSPIHVRPKRVEEILGTPVARPEMLAAVKAIGASATAASHGALLVTPPSYRADVKREIDVIEEIARVIGYARIGSTMPLVHLEGGDAPQRLSWERRLKRLLTAYGFCEAVCLSFTSSRRNVLLPGLGVPGTAVTLANPISRDEPELRRSVLGGLLTAWCVNRNQGASGAALFSIGHVYWQTEVPGEAVRLGGVLAGEMPHHGLGAPRSSEFADVKGVVEALLDDLGIGERVGWERAEAMPFHPGKSAWLRIDGDTIGVVGALHPDVAFELDLDGACWAFELDIEKVLPYCPQRRIFAGLPRFPGIVRDIAVVVDEDFASEKVVRFVRQWQPELVEAVALFDAYSGAPIPPGKKSLAYSITYRAAERTLTDEEVNALHAQLITALGCELGVEQRQ